MGDTFDGNVFFLTADSLRSDYFTEATRRLAALTNGTVFTEAVSTAPFTLSAMPSLAAGVYGDTAGIGLSAEGPPIPIAEVLSDHGYTNCLVSDNYLFGSAYNYQRGFHMGDMGEPTIKKRIANALQNSAVPGVYDVSEWIYFNILKNVGGDHETFYRSAAALHDVANDQLATTDDAVFCWVHYMDTHHPFEPPREYLDAQALSQDKSRADWASYTRQAIMNDGRDLSEQELEDIRRVYRACCEYFADELLAFVRNLVESGHYIPERDVLVFTADHGEGLTTGDRGSMGHTPATYWEEVVRVPLLIAHPGWDERRVNGQVSLIDVMPTVLDGVGCPVPDGVEGDAATDPEDLVREEAFFVGVDPIGSIESADEVTVTRGVRTAAGEKFFGNRRTDGDDSYVYSTVTDEYDDDVLFETTEPDDANVPERMVTLRARLEDQRGVALGELSVETLQTRSFGEIDMEDHLRDLGYIE